MKIDFEKLNKKFWFEDANGNEVSNEDPEACYYRSCFPKLSDINKRNQGNWKIYRRKC